MNIKEQNIYTDLFFTRPQRVLDFLNDNIVYFQNQCQYVHVSGDCPEVYIIPFLENSDRLSAIMDIDKYLEESSKQYDDSDLNGNISLLKLFSDFNNEFGVTIKVDSENIFCIYVEEWDFKYLFELTYQSENPSTVKVDVVDQDVTHDEYTREEIEQLKIKADKWDNLSKAVSEFYCNEDGEYDNENPVRSGNLGDIGEVASIRLGWL